MTRRQKSWLLPPLAVFFVLGVFAGRATGSLLWPCLAAAAALAAFFILRPGALRFCACLLAALSVGAAAGHIAFHPSLPPEADYDVTGIISGEISSGRFGQVRVPLSDVTLDGHPFSGGAYWTFYTDESEGMPEGLEPGRAVSFRASLYHPSGAVNPNGYDHRENLLRRGITVGVYGNEALEIRDPDRQTFAGFTASLRHRLSVSLTAALGEENGRYASALLLGLSSMIPSEDHEAFANLGIAHLLSVSGFHVGILIGVLAALFRLLKLRQGIRLTLYAVFLFFYAALCGMNQPVIRAALLTLLVTEGRILNRPRSGLHLLSASMILTALFSPVQVTGASFQLSYAAMFGLIWFSPLCRRLDPFRNRAASRVFRGVLLAFALQAALLLPELYHYQRLPLWGFLLNLPAMGVFSVLILVYWVALLLLPVPGAAALLARPLSAAAGALFSAIRSLGSRPGLTLWLHAPALLTALGILLLLAGLCFLVRLKAWQRGLLAFAGLAALVLSLLPVPHPAVEYIQFSAGNADAAVLRDGERVFVVDTGDTDGQLSQYLRFHRLTPEAVILTHLHSDHAGGLDAMVRDGIPIPLLYLPEGAEDQDIHPDMLALLAALRDSGTEIRHLARGDVLPLPSGSLTVLWPEKGKIRPGQDANHYSLAARLLLRETSLLLTGDLTGSYEHYAAAPADVLKAAHHGSSSSTFPEFLEEVSPQAVLLSCKAQDRTDRFRERAAGIPVWSTAESGALTLSFGEGNFTVTPYVREKQTGGND